MYQSSDIYQAINKQINKYKSSSTARQWSFFVHKFKYQAENTNRDLPKMVLTVYGEAVRLSVREMGKYGKYAAIY